MASTSYEAIYKIVDDEYYERAYEKTYIWIVEKGHEGRVNKKTLCEAVADMVCERFAEAAYEMISGDISARAFIIHACEKYAGECGGMTTDDYINMEIRDCLEESIQAWVQ